MDAYLEHTTYPGVQTVHLSAKDLNLAGVDVRQPFTRLCFIVNVVRLWSQTEVSQNVALIVVSDIQCLY